MEPALRCLYDMGSYLPLSDIAIPNFEIDIVELAFAGCRRHREVLNFLFHFTEETSSLYYNCAEKSSSSSRSLSSVGRRRTRRGRRDRGEGEFKQKAIRPPQLHFT